LLFVITFTYSSFFTISYHYSDHLEDLAIDRKIVLHWMLGEMGWEGVDWVRVAHGRNR